MSKPAFALRAPSPALSLALAAASPPYEVGAGSLGSLLVGGQLVWELRCALTGDMLAAETRFLDATVGGVNVCLRYNVSGSANYWLVQAAGSTILTVAPSTSGSGSNINVYGAAGQELRITLAILPAFNVVALGIVLNGVAGPFASGAYSTAFSGSCTALRLGAKLDGTSALPGTLSRFRAFHPSAATLAPFPGASGKPATLFVGDSVQQCIATVPGVSPSSLVYTASQVAGDDLPWAVNLSCPGQKAEDQQGVFSASHMSAFPVKNAAGIIGINNANAGAQSAATIDSNVQSLINTIATALPGARILWGPATPCKSGIGSTAWTQLAGFNADLASGAITGVTLLVSGYYALLSDGSDNLKAAADGGDGVHPKTGVDGDNTQPGRITIADAWRAAL